MKSIFKKLKTVAIMLSGAALIGGLSVACLPKLSPARSASAEDSGTIYYDNGAFYLLEGTYTDPLILSRIDFYGDITYEGGSADLYFVDDSGTGQLLGNIMVNNVQFSTKPEGDGSYYTGEISGTIASTQQRLEEYHSNGARFWHEEVFDPEHEEWTWDDEANLYSCDYRPSATGAVTTYKALFLPPSGASSDDQIICEYTQGSGVANIRTTIYNHNNGDPIETGMTKSFEFLLAAEPSLSGDSYRFQFGTTVLYTFYINANYVSIVEEPTPGGEELTFVILSSHELELVEGAIGELSYQFSPTSYGGTFEWHSNNENIVTVSDKGGYAEVTAVGTGTATISITSAEYPNICDECVVTVNEQSQPETMTSYSVIYDPNGTDEEPYTDFTERVPEGDEVEYMLLQNMFSRPNYIFIGWSTDSSSQTPNYEEGEKVYLRNAIRYYAVWESQEPETQAEITSLELLENPPSIYYVGDVIDFQNIILVAHYSDGNIKEVTSNEYTAYLSPQGDPYEPLVAGDYMLYFTYEGFTTESGVPVYVNERQSETYEFEIIFVANNGTSETQIDPFTLPESSTTYDLPSIEQIGFTREGYSFVGWSYSSDGEVLTEAPVIQSGTTTTFYAIWELVGPRYQYTVTFDGNGATSGSTDPIILSGDDYSQTIIFPVCGYVREGYVFAGWGFNPEALIKFQPGEERNDITSDTTFYAIWTQSVFTISFDANGGTGEMSPRTYEKGDQEVPGCDFVRDGYSFAGWAVNSPDSETIVQPEESVNVNQDYVLYALWELVGPTYQYTVTFDGNGATSGSTDPIILSGDDYSQTIIFPVCGYVREGYVFAGWGFNPEALIKFQPGEERNDITSDTTFYAIWTQSVFTISFDANGGTGEMSPRTYEKGDQEVPGCDFVREGYTFAGWAVDDPDSATIIQAGESVYVSKDYILYALWEESAPEVEEYSFEIVFDANNRTGETSIDDFVATESTKEYVLPSASALGFSYEGHTFVGWSLTSDGEILPETYVVEAGATVFYAIWQEDSPTVITYTVNFYGNGETSGTMTSITCTSEDHEVVPECAFEKEGYEFAGWAVGSADSTTIIQPGMVIDESMELYATWNVVTPEPVYRQYWTYADGKLKWVDEAHPDEYTTRIDKVIYSERSLTASVLISILNKQNVVVDTKYISLSNASYELISDGYGSVTGYFNLLIEDDKVIVLNNVVIAVEKIPVTPEEKAADVSEEQIAQINSLLPETQDSRVEDVISDLNQGTAYQIVEVATDAKSFIDDLRQEGGEGYTEEDYQRDLQTVQSATEAAVVVGAAAKDTNISTQVQEMTKSVPEDTGVNLNSVLKGFYEQQMQYLLGEAVAEKDGEQPTRRITRAEAPKVNKVDVTDFLKQEFDQMLDFVDRSVDDIEDTLLQVRKCSGERVKIAVNQTITNITSESFRNFDKEKADREFVEKLEPVMMATMQSQVLATLEEEYNKSNHRNKEKDQVMLDEIEAIKDIETFRIIVMEVLRQKYEALTGISYGETPEDLQKFTDEVYWPAFEAWALDKESPIGITFEELTKATIESSTKRANNFVYATTAGKPEIIFISIFAGVAALAVGGAFVVPTILKKKRRGLVK